ncbi:multidrug effflux MFS transporter [Oricola thermophila]|uniref:Bcr/CflA family efflux transporter n=1 Tax=Oricola thermophila TaxID=2742145 RepID=A0A6N1V8Y3_9HYPH|nr:multidrug effflux MFS transporter [Oricola thermophila]QKV17406.1 multidrug effflux MFS transporter [Oricola thermophila]
MQPGFLRSAIVLGLLAWVGPFAIDMYLPALPAIAEDFGTSVTATQATLTAYFIAFGIAQLVYGPMADWVGRKRPIYVGLGIFMAGSLACALAPSIGWLVAGRSVQALGAATVMVVPRAIVRDLYTGTQATRMMALIMLVISVSPMLAPLSGAGLIALGDWRLIFQLLAVAALLSILLTAFGLPETLPPERRVPVRPRALLSGIRNLLGDPRFVGLTLIGGFGMASFFVFLSSASFVYTGQYGLSPVGFSLAFAVNAIGFFGASQVAPNLGDRFGMARMVLVATTGFAVSALILLGLTLAGFDALFLLIAMLFVTNSFFGLVMAPVMVMALDDHGDKAGLASSLGGTLQMLAGGLMIVATGPFFDGTSLPMVASIAFCATTALVLAVATLRSAPRPGMAA